jgi:MFS superfamily sulfate permease-like transporter
MSRTAVNVQSARTQVASFVTVGLVLLVLLFATDALYYLPKSCLAAIIIVAGFWLIEVDEATWLYQAKRDEFYVWMISFVLTIVLGIVPGLLGSIVTSLLAVMIKTKRPVITILARQVESGHFVECHASVVQSKKNDDAVPSLALLDDALVLRVEGTLYFGNTEYVSQYILDQLMLSPHRPIVVLDASYLYDIDATAIQVFKNLIDRFRLMHPPQKENFHSYRFGIANARHHVAKILGCSGLCKSMPDISGSIDATLSALGNETVSNNSDAGI